MTEYYQHLIAKEEWELQRTEFDQAYKSTAALGGNTSQDLYAGGQIPTQHCRVLQLLNIPTKVQYLVWKDMY